MIYDMPAKAYTSAAEMLGAAAACHARLRGRPAVARTTHPRPEPVAVPVAEPIESLPCVLPPPCPMNMMAPPAWKFLRSYVAAKHGVTAGEIASPTHRYAVVRARNELAHLMDTHTEMSSKKIGLLLGRDHSTILHSIKRHRAAMEKADA